MLIPTKYEDVNYNLLVIGANTIRLLKIKPYNVENLFQKLKHDHYINLEQFFNSLTFLWLAEIINVDLYQISLNKKL